ncbi:hypothetical protein JOD67_006706 [Tenggerimyces flavus]|nr:hypothetical protein [Tenggerimyces flavus]
MSYIRPITEAAARFELIDQTPQEVLQVVLSFEDLRLSVNLIWPHGGGLIWPHLPSVVPD